ncbi:MAG TPA: tetratricopeptide repeat protein [Thermoanaerobaculia bacterium]|jgi:tetratricopeptide (TPR) repeat protein|nr:tetratricopeptide repeat protein [Thermoanaerobaculia bacterium]
MKRLLILAVAALTASGCAGLRDSDPSYENPFYAKYLNTGSDVDTQITRTLEALRQNPDNAELHNGLGTLLIQKGFPKDAEREFERAVDADSQFFPAWYNLGLVRAAHGDDLGARRAFSRTVDLKPGHAPALFQLGLVEEKRHHTDRAVKLYAKAYSINPQMLRTEVNPRILDSKLTHLALLEMYPKEHARRSMSFQGLPVTPAPAPSAPPPAPSQQPEPRNIVTPQPPVTQTGSEPTPVHAPSAPAERRRGRQPRPRVEPSTESTPSTIVPAPEAIPPGVPPMAPPAEPLPPPPGA